MRQQITAGASALLCCGVTLLCGWPGIVQTDATTQWHEARTALVTSQHPPFMAFVWHWLDRIQPGPGLMLALQAAPFWAAALVLALHARMGAALAAAFFAVLLLWPSLLAREAEIMKDVLGGNLVLLAWCLLLKDPDAPWRRRRVAAAFALLGLACLARYQFTFAVLPALALVSLPSPGRGRGLRRALLALLCLGATIGAAQIAVRATLAVDPVSARRSLFTVQLYDVAGIVAREPGAALDVFARRGIDVETLAGQFRALYTPDRSDGLQWWPDGVNVPRLRGTPGADTPLHRVTRGLTYEDMDAQWRAPAFAHPRALVEHRLASFGRLMGFGDVYACWPTPQTGFSKARPELWADLGADRLGLREPAVVAVLRVKWFPSGTVAFRPWAYFALSVVLAGLLLRRGWRTNAAPLALLASCWLYWSSFLLANAACDVRYSYFPTAATLFVSALVAARLVAGWRIRRPRAGPAPVGA